MSKNKKDKTPLPLKVIRTLFPLVEKIFPVIAYRYFIKIFFTPFRYPVPEKEKEFLLTAEKFSLTIQGKSIQAYQWGQGPIVLFVHGWAGRASQFRKFVDVFVKNGFQCIAFDAPAHGASQGKKTNITEFNEVINAIVKQTSEPTAIITHSFGGVATLYTVMKGLPVKKIINIGSPTIGDEIIKTYLRAINGSKNTGEYFKQYVLRTQGKPFEEFTSVYFIKHMPHPINLLLIHDEQDKEAPIIHAETLVELYPSTTLIKTNGLGHTRILKDEQVIETCLHFIASEG